MTRKKIRSHIRKQLSILTNNKDQLTGETFTDAELNDFIDQASRMFLRETLLLTGTETVSLTNGLGTITDDIIKVNRVEVDDKPIDWAYKNTLDITLPWS